MDADHTHLIMKAPFWTFLAISALLGEGWRLAHGMTAVFFGVYCIICVLMMFFCRAIRDE
jgi:hypothetical protein